MYCKSYKCKECRHYVNFLKCSTMHTICWNKDNYFSAKTIKTEEKWDIHNSTEKN